MSKQLEYTPIDDIPKIRDELQKGFDSGKMKSIAYRKYQLLQLGYMLKDNLDRWYEAAALDLGRPSMETDMTDINPTLGDVLDAYNHVEKWAKPEKPPFDFRWTAMRPIVYKEPKGVCLIISPFNYPIWLTLGPACGAIAAGNAVVLKPAESTPALSSLMAELVPKYLDPSFVRVVNGSIPEVTKLLELPWGHILYTGSGRVGRIIGAAAAKTLTPVSLELGGKSPVFIDPKCDIETATKRLLWGKVVNAGQTCIAPDYILVPKTFQDTLVKHLKATFEQFYPGTAPNSKAGHYARLVTPQAFSRINNLLKGTKGTIAIGGETDESQKYISPTIVKDVPFNDSLMSEEIFGPVLPIVPVEDVDEAIAFVRANDHPLAIYVFSQDPAYKAKVLNNTQSGAISVNDVLVHAGVDGLPFGGTGPSGSGYHSGVFGFNMFTHLRASLDSPSWLDKLLSMRYPPYNEAKQKRMALVGPSLPARPSGPPVVSTTPETFRRSRSNFKWWLFALAVLAAALTKRKEISKFFVELFRV